MNDLGHPPMAMAQSLGRLEGRPATGQLQRWQAVGFGAVPVPGFLSSTAGALLVYFKEQVHRLLTGG